MRHFHIFDKINIILIFSFILVSCVSISFWPYLGISFLDGDDAMRLVRLRDLINGQNWFDPVAHRLSFPDGVEMHWSRIVDVPMLLVYEIVHSMGYSSEFSEKIVLFLFPSIYFIFLIFFTIFFFKRKFDLSVESYFIFFFSLFSSAIFGRFLPGRIDHHAMMTMTTGLSFLLVLYPTIWSGVLSGVFFAISLSIGFENLIVQFLFCIFIYFSMIFFGRIRFFAFGFFSSASIVFLLISQFIVPYSDIHNTRCDVISGFWIVYLVAIGLFSALFSYWLFKDDRLVVRRTVFWVGFGFGIVFLFEFHSCVMNPYGVLSEFSKTEWLSKVGEMQNIFVVSHGDPIDVFSFVSISAMALQVLIKIDHKNDFIEFYLIVFLWFFSSIIGFVVSKNIGLSVYLSAILLALTWDRIPVRGSFRPFVSVFIAFSFCIWIIQVFDLVHSFEKQNDGSKDVPMFVSDFDFLNELSTGRVVVPISIAPMVLVSSPHSILGAPYHRNSSGIEDTLRFFEGSVDQAHEVAIKNGINFVVWRNDSEFKYYKAVQKNNMADVLSSGSLPVWLKHIHSGTHVFVARVVE